MPLQYYSQRWIRSMNVEITRRVTYATHEAVAMPLGTLGLERINEDLLILGLGEVMRALWQHSRVL